MGFFGSKKNKGKAAEAPEQQAPKKSRRIVAPAGKPAAPAAPSSPSAPAAPGASKSSVFKPSAPRPPAPPPAPPTQSGSVMDPMDGSVVAADEPELISAPPRSLGKDPIVVGSSKPPEFSGGLNPAGRRGSGPCRTGDHALLDFLRNKANLLDDEQVGLVKSKAESDSKPIDVAAVELGIITEEQMVNALTQECWVPHLKVDKYEIRKKALDTVAREDATHYGVFPVDKLGSLLTLAMVNPLDAETIRVLESKTGLDIKKVVATRSEITQGIEKYYSGQVQAKDSSIAFTQDVEPKSVTQMMSKVGPSAPPPAPPSRSMPVVNTNVPPMTAADNIVPEIQDIDDLLTSDEAIAPAIIEPISLTAEAEVIPVEPLVMEPIEPELAFIEPVVVSEPVVKPVAKQQDDFSGGFEIADMPSTANDPTLTKKHVQEPPAPVAPVPSAPVPIAAAPVASTPSIAPEFEFEDGTPAVPAAKAPVAPAKPPVSVAPAKPPVSVAPAKPAVSLAPANPPVSAAPAKPPVQAAPAVPARPTPTSAPRPASPSINPPPIEPRATSRFTGTARSERSGIINLIPVTEEEFQHAITHGKSHVFEKWVGLQSRNRIINAVSVESEMDTLLASLYAGAKAV